MSRLSKILLTIGAALLVMQLPSCAPEDSSLSRRLDKAEELMETRPDSALSILRTIDGTRIGNRSQNARYALLYSQALDKNYIDVTNDSLISIAVDYYQSKKESSELMKSLYYQGQILFNNGELTEATEPALKSLDISESKSDHYWIAKCTQLLAYIQAYDYNYTESLRYWDKAAREFDKAGRNTESAFASLESACA